MKTQQFLERKPSFFINTLHTWNPVSLLADVQPALRTCFTSPQFSMTSSCQLLYPSRSQSSCLVKNQGLRLRLFPDNPLFSPHTYYTQLKRRDQKGEPCGGVRYKPPHQGEKDGEVFSKPLQRVSVLQTLVLREDLNLLDLLEGTKPEDFWRVRLHSDRGTGWPAQGWHTTGPAGHEERSDSLGRNGHETAELKILIGARKETPECKPQTSGEQTSACSKNYQWSPVKRGSER